jgi:hypothetical protein
MFFFAFLAMFVSLLTYLVIGLGLQALGDDEPGKYGRLLGILLVLAGCALGAYAFMLFVHAIQLA